MRKVRLFIAVFLMAPFLSVFALTGVSGADGTGGLGGCAWAVVGPEQPSGYSGYNITGSCTNMGVFGALGTPYANAIYGQFIALGYYYDWALTLDVGQPTPNLWDSGSSYVDATGFSCPVGATCDLEVTGTGAAGSAPTEASYSGASFGTSATQFAYSILAGSPWGTDIPLSQTAIVNGVSAPSGDCTLVSLSGTSPIYGGETYDYGFSYTGAADYIVFATNEAPDFSPSNPDGYFADPTIDAKEFSTGAFVDNVLADNILGIVDESMTLDMSNAPYTGYYAGSDWTTEAWCYSTTTGWVDWGSVASLSGDSPIGTGPPIHQTTGGGGFDLNRCFTGNWGGWNIGVDILGLLKDGVCVLQWLFEPQECTALITKSCYDYSAFQSDLDATIPFSYVAGGITDVTSFVGAADSSDTLTACDAPSIGFHTPTSGYFHDINVGQFSIPLMAPTSCGGALPGEYATLDGTTLNADTVGELFGFRLLIRDMLAFGVWLTFIAIAWGMMPWSRVGDGISVITSGGGILGGISGAMNGVEDVPDTQEGANQPSGAGDD